MTKYAASLIREIPDFPSSGILFKDITPLLKDPKGLREVVDAMAKLAEGSDVIAGIESRGFVLGAAVATVLGKGFVPIRKKGKLPHEVHEESYGLEYGTDVLQIHKDAIEPGEKVFIIDDVLATGGTMVAAAKLILKCGGIVTGSAVLLEIEGLPGQAKIQEAFPGHQITVLF